MTHLNFTPTLSTEQTEQLDSYSQTLALITSIVYGNHRISEMFYNLYSKDKMGHVEHTQICIEMATEFENLHYGTEWDGDWYDTVQNFIIHKLA